MKKILQFLLVYIVVVGAIFSFNYNTLTGYEKRLSVTNKHLNAVEYLKHIYLLSVSVARYMGDSIVEHPDIDPVFTKKEILIHIDSIHKIQDQNKECKDKSLNAQIELIKQFTMSESEYYKFLNSINHENYVIGDKSGLLFEEDRKLYFLGSLITHYMPEYLISAIISHNIIEEFFSNDKLSTEKKNMFIEQNKLLTLSSQEISGIIKLLDEYNDTRKLQEHILGIEKIIQELKYLVVGNFSNWEDKEIAQLYIDKTHELLYLSYELNNENLNVIKAILENNKTIYEEDIIKNKIMLSVIILIFSLLMYFYYRLYISSLKKDMEIRETNKTLDKFVVFSKTDLDGRITYTSSALEELSGYTGVELIGNYPNVFRHEDNEDSIFKDLWSTILDKKTWTGELLNRSKDGTSFWVKMTVIPNLDESGNINSFTAYNVDITNQKNLEIEKLKTLERTKELVIANEKLEKLSTFDTLTQIYNRFKLDSALQESYESYKRYKKVFSIILIDVDYFKSVNDTYGHLIGDEVLKSMVTVLKKCIRRTDILGRWGGEEFMIVCEETDIDGAYNFAEKIRQEIEKYDFESVGKKTISLGIAEIEDGISLDELIKMADDSLYYAKMKGRNRSVKYSES